MINIYRYVVYGNNGYGDYVYETNNLQDAKDYMASHLDSKLLDLHSGKVYETKNS